jgi:hypothetical protein
MIKQIGQSVDKDIFHAAIKHARIAAAEKGEIFMA